MSTNDALAPSAARLLVVEDDDRISTHLATLGYPAVTVVATPAAALAVVAAEHPDLVLMDAGDAAHRIRDEYGIPVAHVPRPVDRAQLAIAVNTALTLGANARWNRLQAAVAIALATLPELEAVLKACADALVKNLGAAAARISILDREGAVLVGNGTSRRSPADDRPFEVPPDLIRELARGREPVFTNALGADPRADRLAAAVAAGLETFVSQPLIVEGSVVGVMLLLSRHPLPASTPELLTPLADVVAVGIQRKQLEMEARAQSDQLGLMHSALSTVVTTNDWNLASRLLLLGIMARLRAQSGIFGVVTDGQHLSVLASEGVDRASDPLALEGLYGRVVARADTVCQENFLGVPLKSEGRVIGIIGLAGADGFTHQDQLRLESLAQLAGVMCQAYVTHRERASLESELRQANATLQTTNLELEERVAERTAELTSSNEELERFAYVSSHDLQEPLRVVTSYVQLLARRYGDRLDEDAHRFIKHAVTGVARMQTLINDLLSFSRVGKKPRVFERVSANTAVAKALENLAAAIGESGAVISVEPLPDVLGDESQLVQLFQNLIANAIKFRTDAPPAVQIRAIAGDGEHEFRVRDNGIGIEPQYFDRIFIIFQRLHGPAKYGGTGIGLAICKKIVERHGGRIWVTSENDRGSEFHFTLKPATEVVHA